MNGEPQHEGRGGVARIEAFSDGVIAIIITIMVLELKAPSDPDPDPAALLRLWPTFLAYLLATQRKGLAAMAVYALGAAAAAFQAWLGIAAAALVALFWCVPFGPLDRLFLARGDVAGR